MVWRRALIWSGRVVSGMRLSRAKAAWALKYPQVGIGCIEADEACRRQPVARRLSLCARFLQPVAQRHEFIDLGDDTVLFGEGR